jgi:predicted porin
MKKCLFVFVALSGAAGAASAQTSVTLFGTVDLSGKLVKNDGSARRLSLSQDGLNSSQLGFSGIEDLGGGLKAGFLLLAGVNADTGTANSKFWNRRSTLSLYSNLGEIRLGRDYVPTFYNLSGFDVFGFVGLGQSILSRQLYGTSRQDNSIGYFLPAGLGGIYGQAMASASEGGTSLDKGGRHLGARLGFTSGPVNVAVAVGNQRLDTVAGLPSQKTFNVGGWYDFGPVKIFGYYDRDTLQSLTEDFGSVSLSVPIGQHEIRFGVDHGKLKNDAVASFTNTVNHYIAGYVYNLSKRTAIYSTAARISNGARSNKTVATATSQTAAPTLGGKSSGVEFGVRHFF